MPSFFPPRLSSFFRSFPTLNFQTDIHVSLLLFKSTAYLKPNLCQNLDMPMLRPRKNLSRFCQKTTYLSRLFQPETNIYFAHPTRGECQKRTKALQVAHTYQDQFPSTHSWLHFFRHLKLRNR